MSQINDVEQNAHHRRIKAARLRMSRRGGNNIGRGVAINTSDVINTSYRTPRQRDTHEKQEQLNQDQQKQLDDTNGNNEMISIKWSQHLSILLALTRDHQSPLHLLRGY